MKSAYRPSCDSRQCHVVWEWDWRRRALWTVICKLPRCRIMDDTILSWRVSVAGLCIILFYYQKTMRHIKREVFLMFLSVILQLTTKAMFQVIIYSDWFEWIWHPAWDVLPVGKRSRDRCVNGDWTGLLIRFTWMSVDNNESMRWGISECLKVFCGLLTHRVRVKIA